MKTTTKIKTLLVLAISDFLSNTTSAQDTTVKNYDQGFKLDLVLVVDMLPRPIQISLRCRCKITIWFNKRYSLTLTTGFYKSFVSEVDAFPGEATEKI
jgi:hypothetical protein